MALQKIKYFSVFVNHLMVRCKFKQRGMKTVLWKNLSKYKRQISNDDFYLLRVKLSKTPYMKKLLPPLLFNELASLS